MNTILSYLWLALILLIIVGLLVYRAVQWHVRWDVVKLGGIPVRSEYNYTIDETVARDVTRANEALRRVLERHWSWLPEVFEYRVRIVAPGMVRSPSSPYGYSVKTGALVEGSIDAERLYPFTRQYHVAIVSAANAGHALIHEVIRHIVPFIVRGDVDADHRIQRFADLEAALLEEYHNGY